MADASAKSVECKILLLHLQEGYITHKFKYFIPNFIPFAGKKMQKICQYMPEIDNQESLEIVEK